MFSIFVFKHYLFHTEDVRRPLGFVSDYAREFLRRAGEYESESDRSESASAGFWIGSVYGFFIFDFLHEAGLMGTLYEGLYKVGFHNAWAVLILSLTIRLGSSFILGSLLALLLYVFNLLAVFVNLCFLFLLFFRNSIIHFAYFFYL